MPKSREYCCCAIPLVNYGVYLALIEQFILGILVGSLSVGTPSIVGATTPKFASWVLGVICFIGAGVQVFGFIGVSRENIRTYRKYVTFHGIITLAAFAVAAAWIVWSATGHTTAKNRCIANFFTSVPGSSQSEGETLCNIFSWVSVGIMGGLFLLLAILQGYLFIVLSSYGKNQRRDHDQYDRVYDPSQPLKAERIPLDSEPWDSRQSVEVPRQDTAGRYRHLRQQSSVSAADVLSEPQQLPKDGMMAANYDYDPYDLNDDRRQQLPYPNNAYTQAAAPTPTDNYHYYNPNNTSHIERPTQAQAHPAEGSFRRKTPRLQ